MVIGSCGGSGESSPNIWASHNCPKWSRYCSKPSFSRNDRPNRLAEVEVESFAAGDFHEAVIKAEEIEDGGMDVGYVVAMLGGVEAELVGGAVDDTALDPAAG